jgi:hypothetical protein
VNLNVFLILATIGGLLGSVLDFAIKDLKAKDRATDLWVAAQSDTLWDGRSILAAYRFAKQYLDRLFGQRLLSIRVLAICLIVAILSSDITFGLILAIDKGPLRPVRLVTALADELQFAASTAIYGLVDAVSLLLSRIVIARVVQGQRSTWIKPMLALFLIAYVAMGLALYSVTMLSVLLTHNTQMISPLILSLTVVVWLPVLLHFHNISLILLTLPGAFSTVLLIVSFSIPLFIIVTRGISRPMTIRLLDTLASLPDWTGRAIALLGGVAAVLRAFIK